MSSIDKENIVKLPILDLDNKRLDKDVYTILTNINKQYLVTNAHGVVFTIDESEAKKLKFTNADDTLSGYFTSLDSNTKYYERMLALGNVPLRIEDGQLTIMGEISGDLILPSVVESLAGDCWLRTGKINTVMLSPNIKEITQGSFDDCNADVVILPVGILSIKSFGFQGCHIKKLIIQGNTVASVGAFNNADIKEIYVNNALLNKYRQVINARITLKDIKDFN
jgi:hypothetical protein